MGQRSTWSRRADKRQVTRFMIFAAATLCGSGAEAASGIVMETVSDYSYVSGGSHNNDTDANTEGAGFWNAMTAFGTLWTSQVWYQDNYVYDRDFYDPDLTGNSSDNDTNNFDQVNAGISFVVAHGLCDDDTNVPCTSDANCGANSYCPDFPPTGRSAACVNYSPRRIVTSSSVGSIHSNAVMYGYNPTGAQPLSVALGEDYYGGPWAGVGANGGVNIAIVVNSCGMRWRVRTQDQNRFFAGVHEVMMTMPVGNNYLQIDGPIKSDTAQWSARGSTLATLILTNVNQPASAAWLTPSFVNSNYSGYGANVVSARDIDATAVINRVSSETWAQSESDFRDATSSAVGTYWYSCNFSNCSSYRL